MFCVLSQDLLHGRYVSVCQGLGEPEHLWESDTYSENLRLSGKAGKKNWEDFYQTEQ